MVLILGFLQTKWVAERLAEAARNRGIPVNIYRPGRICGAAATGACQRDDFYWGFLGACLKMGSAPSPFPNENMIPVDYASVSIVRLAQDAEMRNRTYHIPNNEALTGADLLEIARGCGYAIRSMPYAEWQQEAVQRASSDPENFSSRFAGFLFNADEAPAEPEPEPVFSAPLTWSRLDEMGIACPKIGSDVVKKHIDFFVRDGLYPPPLLSVDR